MLKLFDCQEQRGKRQGARSTRRERYFLTDDREETEKGLRFFAFKRENEHRCRSDLERISDTEHYEFRGKKERNRVGRRVTPLE